MALFHSVQRFQKDFVGDNTANVTILYCVLVLEYAVLTARASHDNVWCDVYNDNLSLLSKVISDVWHMVIDVAAAAAEDNMHGKPT